MKTFEDGKQISFTKYNRKKTYRSGAAFENRISTENVLEQVHDT